MAQWRECANTLTLFYCVFIHMYMYNLVAVSYCSLFAVFCYFRNDIVVRKPPWSLSDLVYILDK